MCVDEMINPFKFVFLGCRVVIIISKQGGK